MSHVSDGALHSYLDGESSERERAEIETHLAECEACRERLREAESLGLHASELLAELEPTSVESPAWREIEERAAARQGGTTRTRRWARPGLAWAASIAVAFAVGWISHSYWPAWSGSAATGVAEPPALATDALAGGEAEAAASPADEPVSAVGQAADEQSGTAYHRQANRAPALESRGQTGRSTEAAAIPPAEAAAPNRSDVVGREEAPQRVSRLSEEKAEATPEGETSGAAARSAPPETASGFADLNKKEAMSAELEETRSVLTPRAMEALAERSIDSRFRSKLDRDFVTVSAEAAPEWLGVRMRTLPGLELVRVEVGPGSTLDAGVVGRPAIRLVYQDATGREILLTQQWTGAAVAEQSDAALVVEPSGLKSYRWFDGGYRLTLQGMLAADSLRQLAARVR